jgi:hypothetical protein
MAVADLALVAGRYIDGWRAARASAPRQQGIADA